MGYIFPEIKRIFSLDPEHGQDITKGYNDIADLVGLPTWTKAFIAALGLIPRPLGRFPVLWTTVLPSFFQKRSEYPVACCGDYLLKND